MRPRQHADRIEARVVAEDIPAAHKPIELRPIAFAILDAHGSAACPCAEYRHDVFVSAHERALHALVAGDDAVSPRSGRQGYERRRTLPADHDRRVRLPVTVVQRRLYDVTDDGGRGPREHGEVTAPMQDTRDDRNVD